MALSKDLFDDSEIEAAARKISNHCNSRGCVSCKFCLDETNGTSCLFTEYGPDEWESVLDNVREWEEMEREGRTWKEWEKIQQEKNGKKES